MGGSAARVERVIMIAGMNRRLTDDYKPGDGLSSGEVNLVHRLVNGAVGYGGIRLAMTPAGGLQVEDARGVDESFGVTQGGPRNTLIRIAPGYVNFHGVNDYLFPETDLAISGGPKVWIYARALWADWDDRSIVFASGTVRPQTDTSEFTVVLWEFDFIAASNFYSNPIRRAGGQDVQIMLANR